MRVILRFVIISLALIQSFSYRRYKKKDPKKIAIFHNLLLGDTLLLAPLMKRTEEKYPKAKKLILVNPKFISLFSHHPYSFHPISFDPRKWIDLWRIFQSGPYDLAFVVDDNRYSWLARAMGSLWIIGIANDKPLWKNWMLDESIFFDNKSSTWADMLGRLVDGKNPKPYIKNEWRLPKIHNLILPFSSENSYVVCHLGASNPLRFWSFSSWRKLIYFFKAQKLGVALTVGPGEEHLLDEIDPDHQCFHVRGNYSLIEMWVLLERSRLLISSDTGIAHLAKLVFIPSIILYGPGSPLIHGPGRFWINLPQSSVTVNSYPCRDQNLFFRREVLWLKRCTRKLNQCETPGACMNTITAENVITASKLLLKKI